MALFKEHLLSVPEASRRDQILAQIDLLRDEITLQEVKRAIPKECYELQPWRGLVAFFSSILVVALSVWGLVVTPWWAWPIFWFLAGTGLWGMFVIGHDCGHGSFTDNRRVNYFFGHVALLPLLYPFHSWRLQHNHHHAHANRVDEDIDWCPIPRSVYVRMKKRDQGTFRRLRTWMWWYAVIRDWATRTWNPKNYREKDRRMVVSSIVITLVFGLATIPTVIYFAGPLGFLKLWVVPWIIAYAYFALITMLHHTHPEVPNLDKRRWSRAASGLALTVYCRYPRWLEFLMHDINVHVPHHISSAIPYYHLRKAHAALESKWPEMVRETQLTPGYFMDIMKRCHLYEHKAGGFYLPFAAVQEK